MRDMGSDAKEPRHKEGEHPAGDAGQLALLLAFLAVWTADSFFLRWSTFLSDKVHLYIRLSAAALLLAAAVGLELSGHSALGKDVRMKNVKRDGAFRYVRHPLYLASLLFYLGLTVSTMSLFSLAMLVIIFIFYDYISAFEEMVMVWKFGDEYERYRDTTGKWMPGTGRKRAGRTEEGV